MGYQKSMNLVPPQAYCKCRGSVMYGVANNLAKVLKPLAGKSQTIYKILGTLLKGLRR